MHIKKLSAVLLLTGMLAQPAAQAAEDNSSAKAAASAPVTCDAGTVGCLRVAAAERREISSHQDRQKACAREAQDCDPRGKHLRDRDTAEARDRHACRD
jgi:hypothetical protein